MTKILVGIDGSERGERALEWAVLHAEEEATATGEASELTLYCPQLGTFAGRLE